MSRGAFSRGWSLVLAALLIALLGAGAAAAVAWQDYQRFLSTPLNIDPSGSGSTPAFRVDPGDTVLATIRQLDRRAITRFGWHWRLLLRLEPTTIQAGEYALEPGMTPTELLDRLERGEVIQYRFTIVEGWTYEQLRVALLAEERLAIDPDQLAAATVMQQLGRDAQHPEGWFLPETYAYTASDTALDVLSRAHEAMREALNGAWQGRRADLPLDSAYELLTLASIVEKESSIVEELPRIAGVFVRRLEQNWRLETDPTVIYGMGERFDGNIRRRDLRAPTPYNTYVIRGLPPTPIAMPGEAALQATANPVDESAMFFVADGTGGHVFSTTLDEHNRAVQDYLRWLRQRDAADGSESG